MTQNAPKKSLDAASSEMNSPKNPPNVEQIFSERARAIQSSAIREILKVTERPEVISFAGGLPSAATFPVAEGIGVFVGIIAWDLFNDGHLELIKAIAIAAPCSLIWYGIRYWKARMTRSERH